MPMTPKQHGKPTPDEHDYPAARDYLSLLMPEDNAAAVLLVRGRRVSRRRPPGR
jgi:hypothetical protein